MILRRLVPAGPELDLDDRPALLDLYRPPRSSWLRLNMVATIDGSAAGSDGTSESLTNRADRRILGVIRELAEVVLVGAASVRAEGYQLPKRAPLAVVTRSGDLGGHRLDDVTRVVVLGPESARARAAETIGGEFVPIGDDPVAIVDALHSNGWRSIVCEGGPSLATELLTASLVDEFCLTTTSQLGGRQLPLLTASVASDARLDGLLTDEDGTLFARWRLSPSAARRASA